MSVMTPGSWVVLGLGALLCLVPWMFLKRRRERGEREVTVVGAGPPIIPWLAVAALGWLLAAWVRSKWGR